MLNERVSEMGRFQLDIGRLTEVRGSNSLVFSNCELLLTQDAIDNRFVPMRLDTVAYPNQFTIDCNQRVPLNLSVS